MEEATINFLLFIILFWCLSSYSQTESVNILQRFLNHWREIIETKTDTLESGNTLLISRQIQRRVPRNDILANETQECMISYTKWHKISRIVMASSRIGGSREYLTVSAISIWPQLWLLKLCKVNSCPISFSVIKPVASNPLF